MKTQAHCDECNTDGHISQNCWNKKKLKGNEIVQVEETWVQVQQKSTHDKAPELNTDVKTNNPFEVLDPVTTEGRIEGQLKEDTGTVSITILRKEQVEKDASIEPGILTTNMNADGVLSNSYRTNPCK